MWDFMNFFNSEKSKGFNGIKIQSNVDIGGSTRIEKIKYKKSRIEPVFQHGSADLSRL